MIIPRLKPDAVPSVFLWNQGIKESETSNCRMDEDQHSAVIDRYKQDFVTDSGTISASFAEPLELATTKRPSLELDYREQESSKTLGPNPPRKEQGYGNPVIEPNLLISNDKAATSENRSTIYTVPTIGNAN